MEANRDRSLDLAKGIAILVMPFSHLQFFTRHESINAFNDAYLVIFKIPIFIIISGILLKETEDFTTFSRKKTDGLLKPLAAVLFITLLCMAYKNGIEHIYTDPIQVIQNLKEIYYPAWFIVVLFISLMLFRALSHIMVKSKGIILIPLFLIAIAQNILYPEILITRLTNIVLYFLLFLQIGNLIRRYDLAKKLFRLNTVIYSLTVLFFYIILKDYQQIQINIWEGRFDPFLAALIVSLCSSHIILWLSNILKDIPVIYTFLYECSRSSFFILIFHVLFGNYILYPLFEEHFHHFFFSDVIGFVMAILLCILTRRLVLKTKFLKHVMLPIKFQSK
jgi:hypothetical protein